MLVNHHKKEAENEGQMPLENHSNNDTLLQRKEKPARDNNKNHKQAGPTYTIRHIPLTIRDIPDNNYWIKQNYIMSTLC